MDQRIDPPDAREIAGDGASASVASSHAASAPVSVASQVLAQVGRI